jgi:hypothetical protein
VLVAALAAALLAACGSGGDPDRTAADASPSTTSASGAASENGSGGGGGVEPTGDDGGEAPPFEADEQPDAADPSPDALVSVTDVRVGRHEGFDRVVFETGGTGTPGWDVRYVDGAASQGSGDPVEVDGQAVLEVALTGVGYPYDTGLDEFPIGGRVWAADTVGVTEVVFDGTFEGRSVAFVGTGAQAPFRVYLLENPTRVVVEIADQG